MAAVQGPRKRGLCWPTTNSEADTPVLFTRPGSKVSWLYNWSPHPTPSAGETLQFIPMQWNAVNASSLASHCASCAAPAVLAFNEPELGSQANMTPAAAAETWLAHIEPLRANAVRVGSPGVSSSPHAVSWMREFLARVRAGGGDVDFWALHWYGEGLGAFYDHLWSVHHQLGPEKPVWVTEFACTNWSVDGPLGEHVVRDFCSQSCAYLDTLDWVERYAWFGPMRDPGTVGRWAALLGPDGGLSPLGRVYCEG